MLEAGERLLEVRDGLVDLLARRLAAHAQTDRVGSDVLVNLHRQQDLGRPQLARVAAKLNGIERKVKRGVV